MPMDKSLQTDCDAAFDAMFAQLVTAQEAYYHAAPADVTAVAVGKAMFAEAVQSDMKSEMFDYPAEMEPANTNKRYFQGLSTHAAIPADGIAEAVTVERLADKPGDYQAEGWGDIGVALPAALPCAFACDSYSGPRGDGWVLRAAVISGGQRYQRVQQSGPEMGLDSSGEWVAVGSGSGE